MLSSFPKQLIVYSILSLISSKCLSQLSEQSPAFEVFVSANESIEFNENTIKGNGFGAGIHHIKNPNNSITRILGFEFNQTFQTKKSVPQGKFGSEENVVFKINSITIPIGARLAVGSNFKVHADGGVFFELLPSYSHSYGVFFGLGFNFEIADQRFTIQGGSRIGMRNLSREKFSLYNQYHMVLLGIQLEQKRTI